ADQVVERGRGPMEEWRFVERGAAVVEREEQRAMLDHLLHEDALDRLVETADVGRPETIKTEQRRERDNRGQCGGDAAERPRFPDGAHAGFFRSKRKMLRRGIRARS